MKTRMLLALLLTWSPARAAGREFEQIVKAIETHYHAKPTHIPFLGLGNFVLKTARPAGVSSFRIAVFDDLDQRDQDLGDLDVFMSRLGDANLHPIVQVHSNQNGESTYIFLGNPGKSTRMLVTSIEAREATVLEVKVETEALLRLLRDPEHIGDALGIHDRQDP